MPSQAILAVLLEVEIFKSYPCPAKVSKIYILAATLISDMALKDAYSKMVNLANHIYPISGGAAFRYISLVESALMLNQFKFQLSNTRLSINVFLLGCPGIAKSALLALYESYAVRPIVIKRGTNVGLEEELEAGKNLPGTIIIDDMALAKKDMIKTIEGAVGEGKVRVSKHNVEMKFDVNVAGVFASTFNGISILLGEGYISRNIPVMLHHSPGEQKQIRKIISDRWGLPLDDEEDILADIKQHHKELWDVQKGRVRKMPPIKNIMFSKAMRRKILESSDNLAEEFATGGEIVYYRELNDAYRLASASAMLHCFERDVDKRKKSGVLHADKFDVQLGIALFEESSRVKDHLMRKSKLKQTLIKHKRMLPNTPWDEAQTTDEYWEKKRKEIFEK